MVQIKRPVVIASVGYLIGILWGLYIAFSIIPIFLCLEILLLFIERKSKKVRRYSKLFLHKAILVFALFCVLGNFSIAYCEKNMQNFYKDGEKVSLQAQIITEAEEKDYAFVYQIRILDGKYKGNKLLLNVKNQKETKQELKYGDIIRLQATYKKPEQARNSWGFDYDKYLKSKGILGKLSCTAYQIKVEKHINNWLSNIHDIRINIKEKLKQYLSDSSFSLMMGLLLGDKTYLEDETKENFTNSSLAHILAVSGAHISYLLLGIKIVLDKLKLGKRLTYVLSIFILISFTGLVGISPSVLRASIMAIMILVSKILLEKADIYTSLAFSLILILIYNPYSVWDIGLQLSYLATLGIVLFHNIFLSIFTRKSQKFKSIKELVSISISAQILILPLLALHFHSLAIHFILSNILATPLFAIAILYGSLSLLISYISNDLGIFLMKFLEIDLEALNWVTHLMGKEAWGNILVTRPIAVDILLYYLALASFRFAYGIVHKKFTWEELSSIEKKEQKLIRKIEKNKKRIIYIGSIILTAVIILRISLSYLPQDFVVRFIDVGQGDATLVQTRYHKTILIDGGGSLDKESYDVGEKTLVPYLLNNRIKKIDYLMISHFDADHVRTEY